MATTNNGIETGKGPLPSSSSPGTFMFTRKIGIQSESQSPLHGVLSLFLADEKSRLVIQVLTEHESNGGQGTALFQESFDESSASKSLTVDNSDASAVETLAVLLYDACKEEHGTFRCT